MLNIEDIKIAEETPVFLSGDSKIPELNVTLATQEDYDRYFNIRRQNSGLVEWTQSCLDIHDIQLDDLDKTCLTDCEKMLVLQGMLLVQRGTLQKWVTACEALHQNRGVNNGQP